MAHYINTGSNKLKYSVVKAVLAVFVASIGLMAIFIMLIKYMTRKNKKYGLPVEAKPIPTWSGLYRFSKAEIENAICSTSGNKRKCLERRSGYQVFKGILPSGQEVAIELINRSYNSDHFKRKIECHSIVRHQNIMSLIGNNTALTWETRVKILRDCSLALQSLHYNVDGSIIHGDIKLTNILMTKNLKPKLYGFGLAKMLNEEESRVFTELRGTTGYMDPEFMTTSMLTCASDIYSFGIVALQILSGQSFTELDLVAGDQLTSQVLIIGLVVDEMEKAWQNTVAGKFQGARREMSSLGTP
ncbi:probable leucine-rich repeat receptor-like protein kinase At5g49770 [Actinidia eriantha]|uniref:probable leucine-rich repeat receptor-like protein kinase At5g49770 n=1 Tax=Actinidia eriantha TaxID=165200 RepID=UPI0025905DDF|nr:probable leucine-rich repeat receptor-like protein kinase At5g49770 [Actinidia eriantha]